MTPAMGGYDEVDAVESYDDFESTAEAASAFRPGARVFAPGGLSSATLHTPKGPARLNLPAPVPTLAQFRTLEQAVNANTQRLNAAQTELARVRRELASRAQEPQGQNMLPLLIMLKLLRGQTSIGGAAGSSSLLPLLFLMPGLFGQCGGGYPSSRGQPSGAQDAMWPLMMAVVLDVL